MSHQKKRGSSANESSASKQRTSSSNNENSGKKENANQVIEEKEQLNTNSQSDANQGQNASNEMNSKNADQTNNNNLNSINYIDPQVVMPQADKNLLENINTPIFENSMWLNKTGQKKKAGVYPTKRWGHTSVVYEKYLYIYGGCGKQQDCSKTMQVFRLDCETYEWNKVEYTTDVIPDTRDSHSANIINNKMWIFGGSNSELLFNEFWVFDLQKNEWNNQTSLFKGEIPSPREGHAATVLHDRYLIIIGGFNSETEQIYQDVYIVDTKNKTSKNIGTIRMPVRESQSICVIDDNIYLFGGQGHNEEYYNDLHRLKIENIKKNPSLNVEEIKTKSEFVPSQRSSHQAVAFQNRYIFILGGEKGEIDSNNMIILNDMWVYDTRMNFWHEIKPKCQKGVQFKGRFSFSASVYRDKIIVYGGMQNQNSLLEDIMVLHLRDDSKQYLIEGRNQCSMCDSIYGLTLNGKVLKNDMLYDKRQRDLYLQSNHSSNILSQAHISFCSQRDIPQETEIINDNNNIQNSNSIQNNNHMINHNDIESNNNDNNDNNSCNGQNKQSQEWRYTEDSLVKLPYSNSQVAKQFKYVSIDFLKGLANMITSPFQAIALLFNFLFSLSDQVYMQIKQHTNPLDTTLLLFQNKQGVNHKDFQKYCCSFSHTRFLEFDKLNKDREPYMKENDRMISVSEFSNQIKISGCRLGEQMILESRDVNTYSIGVINFKKKENQDRGINGMEQEHEQEEENEEEEENMLDVYYYSYDELNKRFLTQDGQLMKDKIDSMINADEQDISKDQTTQGLSIRIRYLSQMKEFKQSDQSIQQENNELIYDSTFNDITLNLPTYIASLSNSRFNSTIDYSFKLFSKYYYFKPIENKELFLNNEKIEFANYNTSLQSISSLSEAQINANPTELSQIGQLNLYTFNTSNQEQNQPQNGCLAYYDNMFVFRFGSETQIGFPSLLRIHSKYKENKPVYLVHGSLELADYLKPNLVQNIYCKQNKQQIENQFMEEIFSIKIQQIVRDISKSYKRTGGDSISKLQPSLKKQVKTNDQQ